MPTDATHTILAKVPVWAPNIQQIMTNYWHNHWFSHHSLSLSPSSPELSSLIGRGWLDHSDDIKNQHGLWPLGLWENSSSSIPPPHTGWWTTALNGTGKWWQMKWTKLSQCCQSLHWVVPTSRWLWEHQAWPWLCWLDFCPIRLNVPPTDRWRWILISDFELTLIVSNIILEKVSSRHKLYLAQLRKYKIHRPCYSWIMIEITGFIFRTLCKTYLDISSLFSRVLSRLRGSLKN